MLMLIRIPFSTYAQTDRELLLELVKQQTETNKQVAIIATRLEGLEKSVDKRFDAVDKRFEDVNKRFDDANKRFDMQFYLMLGMLAGIFGLIGAIFWDRRSTLKPIEISNAELVNEIALLKERETKLEARLEEKQLKDDSIFKKLLEKFPDLANLT